jgi:hypothetical protein
MWSLSLCLVFQCPKNSDCLPSQAHFQGASSPPLTHPWLICVPMHLLKQFHLSWRTTCTLLYPVFQGKFWPNSSSKLLRSLGPELFSSPPPFGLWSNFPIWGQQLTPDSCSRSWRCISGDCLRSWGRHVQTYPDDFCPLRSDAATWPGQGRTGCGSYLLDPLSNPNHPPGTSLSFTQGTWTQA